MLNLQSGVTVPAAGSASAVAVRRLQKDYAKLMQDPVDGIAALPNEDNILEWHYCLRGSPDTPFEGGYYWGKVIFKENFPWSPPAITMITPNGRAADWNLDQPAWTGRMRLVSIGKRLEMRLEDGDSGDLYAKCPIDAHPGNAIEAVSDSSRYFVIRLMNDNGQQAFVGCGFQERGDAFDFNVSLQDHFRYIEKSAELEKQDLSAGPSLDLAFKEGQTISISIGKKDKNSTARPRPAPTSAGGLVPLLPPPPGAGSVIRNTRQPSAFPPAPTSSSSSSTSSSANSGNLLDF